jgi:hypothetical protein
MNKKYFWTALLFIFTWTLTACASSKSSTSAFETTGKLSGQTQLILGTINLEETDYAVTTEQAAELLPMFYVLKDLNDSGSAAQEEIDGLVTQIQETMTDEQIKAIDDMSLSMRDMFAVTSGSSGGSNSLGTSSTTGAGMGGGPAGGPPDMGVMPGGPGGLPSTGTTSANSDTSVAPVMDTSTPSSLFDVAIDLLKKKVEY